MNVAPPTREERGLGLLLRHCAALDPTHPDAFDRLVAAVGEELATKLVFALAANLRAQAA